MEIFTKKINNEQEKWYKDGERAMVDLYLGRYAGLIDEMRAREDLTILDIGGGAGYFSRELLEKLLAEGSRVRTVNVYLVDTHPYDTWNDGDERIHFIEGDALNIDSIPGGTYDYVFCNMFFHHLLGDSYKQSGEFRKSLMNKISNVLKPDGKVGIIDNFNDGFLWDQASSRILYFLTTTKNPFIVKACKKMDSKSAGVGVCMISRKMWHRLAESAGMYIVDSLVTEPSKMGIIKKICMINKAYRQNNLMVMQKKAQR